MASAQSQSTGQKERESEASRRVERDIGDIPADSQAAIALEGHAEVSEDDGCAASGGGEPAAGVTGRLLDVENLLTCGSGEFRGLVTVLAAKEALLVAGQEDALALAVDADRQGVFAVQAVTVVVPRLAAVEDDADDACVAEVADRFRYARCKPTTATKSSR